MDIYSFNKDWPEGTQVVLTFEDGQRMNTEVAGKAFKSELGFNMVKLRGISEPMPTKDLTRICADTVEN